MVSYLEYKPDLAKTFVIIQSAFFLLNFEQSSAFTAFKLTNHEVGTGKSKREERPRMYGDFCSRTEDCQFSGAICTDENTCQCQPHLPTTNRKDKCRPGKGLDESCEFDEQCEYKVWNSICVNQKCACRGNGKRAVNQDGSISCKGKRFGDDCLHDSDCAFKHAICDPTIHKCQCHPTMVATNHLDKCGEIKSVNEECFFHEQCEQMLFDTHCINGRCRCRSERTPVTNPDGTIKCIVLEQADLGVHTDPAMIIVLSVMCLMFIIICVVLHLFSKARWRENRTIFNTPNPRLMTVSLLREKKNERRGSKEESKQGICRRESRGGNSNGSARSPTNRVPSTTIYCDTSLIDTGAE